MKVTSGSLHIGLKTRPNYADASIFYQKKKPKKTHTHICGWIRLPNFLPLSHSAVCQWNTITLREEISRPQLFHHNCCRKLSIWSRKRTKHSQKPLPADDCLWLIGMARYSMPIDCMTFFIFLPAECEFGQILNICLFASSITSLPYIFHEQNIGFSEYEPLTGKKRNVIWDMICHFSPSS